jgi:ElaB/YqjD/DUF883 family membrane-anchored ribosome-binding protein
MAESSQAPSSLVVPDSATLSGARGVAAADVSTTSRSSGNDKLQSRESVPATSSPPSNSADSSNFRDVSKAWDAAAGSDSSGYSGNPETRDRLATVKDKLSGAHDAVKEKYRVVTDSTDDFVHENPWKSIALAAVGGMVIGMLIAR